MKYELRINDDVCFLEDLNKVNEVINDELYEQFSISQCYYERVPFSVGVLEDTLYSNGEITDEQIVMFSRIRMLLNDICSNDCKSPLEYIKRNYGMHYKDEYIYDFKINMVNEEVTLELKVDCVFFIDYLKTNMFDIKAGRDYYFKTTQTIVTKSTDEPYNIGDVMKLNITLKTKEE